MRCIGIEHRERSKRIDRVFVVYGLIGRGPTQHPSNIHAKRRFSCEKTTLRRRCRSLVRSSNTSRLARVLATRAISLNHPASGMRRRPVAPLAIELKHVAPPGWCRREGYSFDRQPASAHHWSRSRKAARFHQARGSFATPLGAAGGVLGVSELLRKTRVDSTPMHRVPRGEGRGRRRCRSHTHTPNSDRNHERPALTSTNPAAPSLR